MFEYSVTKKEYKKFLIKYFFKKYIGVIVVVILFLAIGIFSMVENINSWPFAATVMGIDLLVFTTTTIGYFAKAKRQRIFENGDTEEFALSREDDILLFTNKTKNRTKRIPIISIRKVRFYDEFVMLVGSRHSVIVKHNDIVNQISVELYSR